MLSVEKHPPDPPCPCDDIPQLKHSSDESASDKLALSAVDLPKPPLFDENPLPKFSIRDYVFTARRKDIKTNWPFSLKNLQLCLNHGVKDLLPPFQPLDAVRNNQSFQRSCTVDNENIVSNTIIDGEPSSLPDDHEHVVLDSSDETQPNEKLADISAISCRSEGENDFPSTITSTSISQSEIEESVPTNRPASSPVEADAAGPPLPPKTTESTTTRTSGKKCRLIVKFSGQSERSSTEDIASICTNISEPMASKTCPVCKTFSSPSNTTLNAHIDQCLSVESTPKWTVDSKLTRHRIKPRKTRLMVDIYSTAQRCTLEDLDKRNGSSWASSVSSFPAHQDIEKSEMPAAEDKKQRVLAVHHDNDTVVDVGPVYIDANGTKLRILSKFNDDAPSVSKVLEHLRPRKPLKGGKGGKFLSTKKKKCHASKYHKYLKLPSQNKKLLSSKVLSSQISRSQERYSGAKECFGRGGRHVQKQVNPCNSGTLRQWVCSKRTGVAKKLNNKVCRQPVGCKWRVPQDLLVENDQSCNSLMDRSCDQVVENFSGKQISSPENSEKMENDVFYEAQVSDLGKQSPRRKRAGSPLSGANMRGNVKGSLPQMKRKLRKNNTSSNDYHMLEPPKSAETCPTFLGNETVDICADPIDKSNFPPGVSIKQSRSCRSSRSKAMKFSSLMKNSLSVSSRVSVTESESTITNKNIMADVDEEIVVQSSEEDRPYDFMHNYAANQSGREDESTERSLCRNNVLEIRQKIGVLSISGRKETMVMESSQIAPECYQHDRGENIDSAVLVNKVDGAAHKEVQRSIDDIVTQSSSGIAVGETVSSMSKAMDPEHKNLVDRSKTQANSLQHKGPLSEAEVLAGLPEPTFVGREDNFCADEVGNGMLVQNVHIGEELDSDVAQGSSFPEVDRIPIPGPPGSFLPSPRDMGSEDFQGNSSLTTSRVQSSQDQHDFIDGDSSDSPVSATSTISNFTATRYEPKSSEPLPSVGPQLVQERVRSNLSGGSLDSSVENAALAPHTTSAAAERLTFDREKLKVNKKPLSFKSDDQPCCCQRKERASQGVTLSYQDSQLLRRRAMASIMMPAMERQLSRDMNTRSNNSEVRSETSKSHNVVLPVMKCPGSPNPSRDSADAGLKFSGRSDCDSVSPSSSNSILRLMGKNLMVVNRDEDESMPLGQAQPHSQINHLTSQLPPYSGVSPSNIQNQVYHSFLPNIAQGSVILGQNPLISEERCFDARFPINFRTHAGPKTASMLSQGPGSLFSNQHMDGGFMALIEPHDYKSDYNIAAPQSKSKNRPAGAFANHMERVITIPDSQQKNAPSAANSNKEIIIIDDVPESEADNSTSEVVRHSGGLVGENYVVSSGTLMPNCNSSMRPNTLSCCPSPYDPPLQSEPPVLSHNTNFHAVPPRRANASHARWSCTPEGSVVLQQRSFVAASSSKAQLRPALYNSPGLL
ncbi:uncharacterized protein LOC107417346 isoform X1 [Ziziphus jujuba]|uniref:Uncharacterized protein LOC107417346 isoform X1 n=1 Tax=Ziziphus jujuba TaxID=326968 RepID=A0A6P3ZM68_ZIZJJ|nr:uncharacterized protein LOC107417346 isoform X1 [Ziziphus jujuba]XP_015881456.3 uncharacterized protein LOC107417346 isoform X1 [Ziziphus jujuba]XP_015881461.3 uncharacterized protein LOC107417346 isoform X1 [Ziziphus jujuba]XP_015881468.3 uncharacterized protein LOC107417346 isoform X1 [Ziziphus jujuba]